MMPEAVVFLSTSLLCDLVISSVMIGIVSSFQPFSVAQSFLVRTDSACLPSYFQLVECKGGTSRRATQKILNGLIINAVENGAVISACLVLNLALYTTRPGDMIHVSW
jgi:hypothetical protein